MAHTVLRSLTRHIPPDQLGRYVVVGIWNTAFAYGSYAVLTWLLDRHIAAGYLLASAVSSILNITVSFLGYKWFVFRTTGNYLNEWFRCLAVYGTSIVVGVVLLFPTVWILTSLTGNRRAAPYIAGALLMCVNVLLSFLGHRTFTFGPRSWPTTGQ